MSLPPFRLKKNLWERSDELCGKMLKMYHLKNIERDEIAERLVYARQRQDRAEEHQQREKQVVKSKECSRAVLERRKAERLVLSSLSSQPTHDRPSKGQIEELDALDCLDIERLRMARSGMLRSLRVEPEKWNRLDEWSEKNSKIILSKRLLDKDRMAVGTIKQSVIKEYRAQAEEQRLRGLVHDSIYKMNKDHKRINEMIRGQVSKSGLSSHNQSVDRGSVSLEAPNRGSRYSVEAHSKDSLLPLPKEDELIRVEGRRPSLTISRSSHRLPHLGPGYPMIKTRSRDQSIDPQLQALQHSGSFSKKAIYRQLLPKHSLRKSFFKDRVAAADLPVLDEHSIQLLDVNKNSDFAGLIHAKMGTKSSLAPYPYCMRFLQYSQSLANKQEPGSETLPNQSLQSTSQADLKQKLKHRLQKLSKKPRPETPQDPYKAIAQLNSKAAIDQEICIFEERLKVFKCHDQGDVGGLINSEQSTD